MNIVEVHQRLSTSTDLLQRRRDVYRTVIRACESADEAPATMPDDSRLDDPLVRRAIRDALVHVASWDSTGVPQASPSIGGYRLHACGRDIPVVSDPCADAILAEVLDELRAGPASFLTEAEHTEFAARLSVLQAGVHLADGMVPGLAADLLPHVGLVALLRVGERGAPVHSASLRQYPGLLLVCEPRTAIEAAEMLLHESAHARFFDMLIVHDILPAGCDDLAPFQPPWREPGTRWPVEQTVAALHAYAVLAEFAGAVSVAGLSPGAASLLPHAPQRVSEIGAWVLANLGSLGADAAWLVGGLVGVEVPGTGAQPRPGPGLRTLDSGSVSVAPALIVSGSGTAVATRAGKPSDLYVLGADSGLVLAALIQGESQGGLTAAVDAIALRHSDYTRAQAEVAVMEIVQDLADRELVTVSLDHRVDRG